MRAHMTRLAYEELLTERLPEHVASGNFQIVSADRETVRLAGYSGGDALDLPAEILQILPYFDGRPTGDALRAIENDLGIRVEEDLVRKLADFRIVEDRAGAF